MDNLVVVILRYVMVIPAIVFHEVAHGYAALLLGDTTAQDRGRLSLNPLKHLDPFGTVLLPLLLLAMSQGQVAFGYAKPVPVNPMRFKGDRRRGMFLTGIAGPATNLAMAAVAGLLVRLIHQPSTVIGYYAWSALTSFVFVNLLLLFFNLIPIPPLDGSRVLPLFLSDSAMRTYAQWERYGFFIILGVLWVVPLVLNVDPIATYFEYTVYPIFTLLTGVTIG